MGAQQKSALVVACALIVMMMAFEAASAIGGWAAKPVRQKISEAAVGPVTAECFRSEAIRQEQAQRTAVESNAKLKRLQSEITRLNVAVTIVDAGILYLFSYLIVGYVRRRPTS